MFWRGKTWKRKKFTKNVFQRRKLQQLAALERFFTTNQPPLQHMRGSLVLCICNAVVTVASNICGFVLCICNACCNRRFNICEVHFVLCICTYENAVFQHIQFCWISVKSRCSKIPFSQFLVFSRNIPILSKIPFSDQKTLTLILGNNPILSRSHFIENTL